MVLYVTGKVDVIFLLLFDTSCGDRAFSSRGCHSFLPLLLLVLGKCYPFSFFSFFFWKGRVKVCVFFFSLWDVCVCA